MMTTPMPDVNPSPVFTPPVVDDRDQIELRDFTIQKKYIGFRIDADVFYAYALLGATMMQELVVAAAKLGDITGESDTIDIEPVAGIFDRVLVPDSRTRFRKRLFADDATMLDIRRQVLPIMQMLLEEFGVRPTQPSSDLSSGSPSGTDGTPSTAGAPSAALTQPSL